MAERKKNPAKENLVVSLRDNLIARQRNVMPRLPQGVLPVVKYAIEDRASARKNATAERLPLQFIYYTEICTPVEHYGRNEEWRTVDLFVSGVSHGSARICVSKEYVASKAAAKAGCQDSYEEFDIEREIRKAFFQMPEVFSIEDLIEPAHRALARRRRAHPDVYTEPTGRLVDSVCVLLANECGMDWDIIPEDLRTNFREAVRRAF